MLLRPLQDGRVHGLLRELQLFVIYTRSGHIDPSLSVPESVIDEFEHGPAGQGVLGESRGVQILQTDLFLVVPFPELLGDGHSLAVCRERVFVYLAEHGADAVDDGLLIEIFIECE